jgi:hypothetical protein
MTDVLNVNVTDLRRAVGRLLDVVEERHGPTVALGADHYWMLSDDAAFNLGPSRPQKASWRANSPTTLTPYGSCSTDRTMSSRSGMTFAM